MLKPNYLFVSISIRYYLIAFLESETKFCKTNCANGLSSLPEMFLRKCVLKICIKFTGKHPCLKYSFHKTRIYHRVTCVADKQIDFSLKVFLVSAALSLTRASPMFFKRRLQKLAAFFVNSLNDALVLTSSQVKEVWRTVFVGLSEKIKH